MTNLQNYMFPNVPKFLVRHGSQLINYLLYEQRHEKTCLWSFQPGPTQTRLYNHRSWLEAGTFGIRMLRECTIRVAKTNGLISCVGNHTADDC